jgi:hypothetical protein
VSPRVGPAVALVLVAGGIPLYAVLVRGWPVVFVVMQFWFEALVIVAFSAIKVAMVPVPGDRALALLGRAVRVGVTLAFPGGLVLAYGFFLALLFGGTVTGGGIVASPDVPLEVLAAMRNEPAALLAALAVVARHAYAFAAGFVARGQWRTARLGSLLDEPMRRVVVLHVGIVLAGVALVSLAPPLAAATGLILLKTAADLHPRLLR